MGVSTMTPGRYWRGLVLVVGTTLSLVGAAPAPAFGQESDNPLTDLARRAKLMPEPVEPKDFVKQSRPAQTDFLPVGVMPPDRRLKVKSPEELKAMQADLEAAGLRHEKIAGRPAVNGARAGQTTQKSLKTSHGQKADAKDPKS
jgi:hypothetical protein